MRSVAVSLLAVALVTPAPAQQKPDYPEGSAVFHAATTAELNWAAANPVLRPNAVTPPPTGPLHCAAEYEPMDSICVAWEGPGSWLSILAQMAAQITTVGDADFWVSCDTNGEVSSARNTIRAAGADMNRVFFTVQVTDAIWMRDYGPRMVFQGGCRVIIDHTYNIPTRRQDNAFNSRWAPKRGFGLYELPLTHGGGNYHLDAVGRGRATRLINNENRQFTEQQIHEIWNDYQNLDTFFYTPFPRTVDATQHIDMWMQVIDDDKVIISDWPFRPNSTQAGICNATAAAMEAEGFTVYRTPARSSGGVHYTYTNVVMCNNLVLIPRYTASTIVNNNHNTEALTAWQNALPNHTIVQINCQSLVTAAGVMHCIVMHIPEHRGGDIPTAYVIGPNGSEVLTPGTEQRIDWVSDDNEGVVDVDILLSTDGGQTFPTVIAANRSPAGPAFFQVPDICTGEARIRVVARDANGNTGFDDSDLNFAIAGTGCAATSSNYGNGTSGTNGVPTLSSSAPVIGQMLTLDAGNGMPSAPGVMLIGNTAVSVPVVGTTLLVSPVLTTPLAFDGAGQARLNLRIANRTSQVGTSLRWQAYVVDQNGPAGLSCSPGLETVLGF